MINEEAATFDSLLMDSYVSSTTGVRTLLQAGLGSSSFAEQELGSSLHLVVLPTPRYALYSMGPFVSLKTQQGFISGGDGDTWGNI